MAIHEHLWLNTIKVGISMVWMIVLWELDLKTLDFHKNHNLTSQV